MPPQRRLRVFVAAVLWLAALLSLGFLSSAAFAQAGYERPVNPGGGEASSSPPPGDAASAEKKAVDDCLRQWELRPDAAAMERFIRAYCGQEKVLDPGNPTASTDPLLERGDLVLAPPV